MSEGRATRSNDWPEECAKSFSTSIETRPSHRALDAAVAKYGHISAYQIAEAYAWCGEPDRAFAWLERAYAQRDGGLRDVKYDPLLRSLRGDPRYNALLRKMNLPLE